MKATLMSLLAVLASVGLGYGKLPPGTFGVGQIEEAKAEAKLDGKPVAYLLSDSTTS